MHGTLRFAPRAQRPERDVPLRFLLGLYEAFALLARDRGVPAQMPLGVTVLVEDAVVAESVLPPDTLMVEEPVLAFILVPGMQVRIARADGSALRMSLSQEFDYAVEVERAPTQHAAAS